MSFRRNNNTCKIHNMLTLKAIACFYQFVRCCNDARPRHVRTRINNSSQSRQQNDACRQQRLTLNEKAPTRQTSLWLSTRHNCCYKFIFKMLVCYNRSVDEREI
ncbi:hypothetical protein Plhal304r1_c008g0030681 [Plasmopara halstedii]